MTKDTSAYGRRKDKKDRPAAAAPAAAAAPETPQEAVAEQEGGKTDSSLLTARVTVYMRPRTHTLLKMVSGMEGESVSQMIDRVMWKALSDQYSELVVYAQMGDPE